MMRSRTRRLVCTPPWPPPSVADFGQEPLADNPADGIGQAVMDLRLFIGLKHAEDTVDGLAGINGVQGGEG